MVPSRIGPLGWPHSVVHSRSSAPYSRFSFVVFYFLRKAPRRYDMNERFQMQGGKNWILPKDMIANRFFWDSHWLEI
jgi:hypothetical protein